jgi:hypothetical protein
MKEIMAHIIIIMLFEIETFLKYKVENGLKIEFTSSKSPFYTFGVRMNMGQQTLLITCCGKRIILFNVPQTYFLCCGIKSSDPVSFNLLAYTNMYHTFKART